MLLFIFFFVQTLLFSSQCFGENIVTKEKILYDFLKAEQFKSWSAVNDPVMGGVSTGQIVPGENSTAVFNGTVSLENDGGFSSIRTTDLVYKLDDFKGMLIRVKGDGKTYKLMLRSAQNSYSYQLPFKTGKNTWELFYLPFHEFKATYHGRMITNAPQIDPDKINSVGFLISDKQAGPFSLMIDWIKAYTEEQ
jgi:monofunctional biosynthetic peptidoglycan transglycosylase